MMCKSTHLSRLSVERFFGIYMFIGTLDETAVVAAGDMLWCGESDPDSVFWLLSDSPSTS
jgi:hypothetical protein